jgi:hypothetical protein
MILPLIPKMSMDNQTMFIRMPNGFRSPAKITISVILTSQMENYTEHDRSVDIVISDNNATRPIPMTRFGRGYGSPMISINLGRAIVDRVALEKSNHSKPVMQVSVPIFNLTDIPHVLEALNRAKLMLSTQSMVPATPLYLRRRKRFRRNTRSLLQQYNKTGQMYESELLNLIGLDFICLVFNVTTGQWENSTVIGSNYSELNATVDCTLDISAWDGVRDVVVMPTIALDLTNFSGYNTSNSTNPTKNNGSNTTNPANNNGSNTTNPANNNGSNTTNPANNNGSNTTNPTKNNGSNTTNPANNNGSNTTNPINNNGSNTTNPTNNNGSNTTNSNGSTRMLVSPVNKTAVINPLSVNLQHTIMVAGCSSPVVVNLPIINITTNHTVADLSMEFLVNDPDSSRLVPPSNTVYASPLTSIRLGVAVVEAIITRKNTEKQLRMIVETPIFRLSDFPSITTVANMALQMQAASNTSLRRLLQQQENAFDSLGNLRQDIGSMIDLGLQCFILNTTTETWTRIEMATIPDMHGQQSVNCSVDLLQLTRVHLNSGISILTTISPKLLIDITTPMPLLSHETQQVSFSLYLCLHESIIGPTQIEIN